MMPKRRHSENQRIKIIKRNERRPEGRLSALRRRRNISCNLEKRGVLWYNASTVNKEANKTVNINKPEHRKTAVSKASTKPSKTMSFDKLYRKLYAHPKMVEDLIVNFVKERFVEHIDFSMLKGCKTKFVTDRDGVRESDMMYELKIKDETIYFYVLLEFQSTYKRLRHKRKRS